jgi:hypothetical protein
MILGSGLACTLCAVPHALCNSRFTIYLSSGALAEGDLQFLTLGREQFSVNHCILFFAKSAYSGVVRYKYEC